MCYAAHDTRTRGESYWVNLDHTGTDLGREMNRTVIQELEEQIDQYHKDTAHGGESRDSSGDGFNHESVMSQPAKDGSQIAKECDLRYRPNIHPPDRYDQASIQF